MLKRKQTRDFSYDPRSVTDPNGYRSIQQQVTELLSAGKNLQDYRRTLFHAGFYTNGALPEDPPVNVFAKKEMDFFEAHRLSKELNERLKKSQIPPTSDGKKVSDLVDKALEEDPQVKVYQQEYSEFLKYKQQKVSNETPKTAPPKEGA